MFTGIIEEIGEVVGLRAAGDSAVLSVAVDTVGADVVHGASIAVNGVCLTVIGWDTPGAAHRIDFDVMGETLHRSTTGALRPGATVNLERAARLDSRLDGHIVQGHVDGTGNVIGRTPGDAWEGFRFSVPPRLARYIAEKGSIAVDGVSLTVTGVGAQDSGDWFEVGLIPETLRATVLGGRQPGDAVNLEVDVVAKYVERLLRAQ